MEGAHPAGLDARHQALRGAEKIHRQRVPKGAHRSAAGYGAKRPGPPGGFCRGAAPGGVLPHRAGQKPKAHFRRHVELGRGVQSKERMSLCTWLHCVNDLGFSSQNTARRSSQANPWREYSCRFPLSTLYAGKPRTLTHDKLAAFLGEWPPAGGRRSPWCARLHETGYPQNRREEQCDEICMSCVRLRL